MLTNLRLCFPSQSENERRRIARAHFQAFARSLLEHGILWWASKERIQRLVRVEGIEHWQAVANRPVILLAPHFIGLDMGGIAPHRPSGKRGLGLQPARRTRSLDANPAARPHALRHADAVFAPGRNPPDRSRRMRKRLPFLLSAGHGSRASAIRSSCRFSACRPRPSPACRASRGSRARWSCRASRASCRAAPATWSRSIRHGENFRAATSSADARRMNAFIEERVREMPEQYYWLHKRFKTRPPGEPNPV